MPRHNRVAALAFTAVGLLVACSDSEPIVAPTFDLSSLYGDYSLEVLTFDPQGSLPLVNVRARFEHSEAVELVLTESQQFQIVYREGSGLRQILPGTWSLQSSGAGIRMTISDGGAAGRLLLPKTLDLEVGAGVLTFNGPISGLNRADVLALIPEWEGEQLLNPVPGTLVVRFRKGA